MINIETCGASIGKEMAGFCRVFPDSPAYPDSRVFGCYRYHSGFVFLLFLFAVNVGQVFADTQICQPTDMPASAPFERYVINKDATITDTRTQLTWQKCLVGVTGKNCEVGEVKSFSWGDALAFVSEKNDAEKKHGENTSNGSGWRLPNIRELSSLIELQCRYPAINVSVFPNTPPSHQWSSSPYKFYPHYSWYVDFNEGIYTYSDRADTNKHIRLVRTAGDNKVRNK